MHLLLVDLEAVLATLLRLVHGDVGVAQQLLAGDARARRTRCRCCRPTWGSSPRGTGRRSDSRIRPAKAVTSSRVQTSSMRMANSSPPSRAAVSSGRRQPERFVATRLRSWSPSPCPRLSFTVLKSSRSMNSTASWEPVWAIRARACSSRSWNNALLASPVSESWNARYSSSSSQPVPVGDVAEAPDPADDPAGDRLRPGGQLDGAPVLELEGVEALVLRLDQQLPSSGEEGLRVEQLVEDERQLGGVVADRHEVGADAPDLGEPPVEPGDHPFVVDDQDPVGRGVQGGGEE